MKKQLIIATLALTLAVGTSVVSFAQDGVEATPIPTASAVEEETPFEGMGGYGGFNRVSDEERAERRALCDTLTDEEREEFYAQRGEERAARRGGCGALTDEEREERRAERSSMTDEERAEFYAQMDSQRGTRRGKFNI